MGCAHEMKSIKSGQPQTMHDFSNGLVRFGMAGVKRTTKMSEIYARGSSIRYRCIESPRIDIFENAGCFRERFCILY